MSNWYLTGDLDMLGAFSTTKSPSSTAAPYECAVNLGGHALTVAYLVNRGIMVFTNGTVTATLRRAVAQ